MPIDPFAFDLIDINLGLAQEDAVPPFSQVSVAAIQYECQLGHPCTSRAFSKSFLGLEQWQLLV
jgi:hypothetical protein